MTTAVKKQRALFPDMPKNPQMVEPSTGRLLPEWALFLSQLSQALQTNYQREGVRAPSQNDTDLANIKDQRNLVGNIIYDETNKVFKAIIHKTEDPFETETKTFQFV